MESTTTNRDEKLVTREDMEEMRIEYATDGEPISDDAFEYMCKELIGKKHEVIARAGLRHMCREAIQMDLLPGFQDYDVDNDDDASSEWFTSWKQFKPKVIEIARGMGDDRA
jgi:hypothetical protein